ncbi:MAG TPA: alkaline phosphatase PafA [Flavobacteriaceae bacterium]|nr:alkaline phosphatase PafA [Flavobacteriaceae bacterium]
MKRTFLLAGIGLLFLQCKTSEPISQKTQSENTGQTAPIEMETGPKLVVGVVVDQMRYDYLTRFWKKFGEEGFKRLVSEGFNLKNNHYNYVPTFTAPGHASIYTGTTPATHGIISNYWYDKFAKKGVYCVADTTVKPVGTESPAGKMSPHRMLVTTVADQNRLHTQMRGKTIGISLKDRSAILPAGHTANAAYWFHGENEGKFISSSFYMDELPTWVQNFNASDAAENYLKVWDTYQPIETYTESGADLNNFEHGFEGKPTATFPYDLVELKTKNEGFSILKSTPFGNSLVTDFAIAALEGENLGQDETTDFLTVSFSGTDYVGHNFGVNSKEVEDTYIRLDREIAKLLNVLDTKIGKGNYTLFLTADHGGIHVPAYLKTQQIPAGYFDSDSLETAVNNFLMKAYGVDGLVENLSNNQLFFDYHVLKENNIPRKNLQTHLMHFLLQYPKINKVFTRKTFQNANFTEGIGTLIQNGFHQKRSGDVVYVLEPAYISYSHKGSTHGSGMNYDTHVPLIFFGNGIEHGETTKRTEITDIAPTISALLGIAFPNGATGNVLHYVID